MKLKRPNLNADPHAECYLSVHKNRTGCGISTAMADAIDAEGGKYLHFAIDDRRRPWVAVLEEQTPQCEPEIRDNSGCQVNSTLAAKHLGNLLPDRYDNETVRLYMTAETYYDEEIDASLHRLSLPK
jgi:hypothetical protein